MKTQSAMQLGMVGLGRMGANMVRRLLRGGHECVVYDRNGANVKQLAGEGATGASSFDDFVKKLAGPRTVWLMIPAALVDSTLADLAARLQKGDLIVDGGNSHYADDIRRSKELAQRGLHYLDVGTSGGVWGLERGYCLMIGGDKQVVERLDPVFRALAPGAGDIPPTPHREGSDPRPAQGYLHAGPNGAGHFVKMIHNGIEYGLMQAYAEGFDILRKRDLATLPEAERYDLNLTDIAEVWRRGSVISSWLLDL